jgi:hypothetical protein
MINRTPIPQDDLFRNTERPAHAVDDFVRLARLGWLQLELTQSESGYGRSVLRIQVRFISLVSRISWHPILLGRKRMNHASLKSRLGECTFHRQVVVTRSFHDDHRVLNVMLMLDLANLIHGQLETGCLMLERLRVDEQVPEVVGHHPLGPVLGRINTHDRKPLTAYLLDAGANDAIGFLERLPPWT